MDRSATQIQVGKWEMVIELDNSETVSPGMTWKCLDCGECCKELSLSKDEYNLILKSVPKTAQEYLKRRTKPDPNEPKLMQIKGNCPFFSKEQKKCLIYKIRPYVCRAFNCGRNSLKDPVIFVDGHCINHTIRLKKDPWFRMLVIRDLQDAMIWAKNHGWELGGV